MRCATLLLLSLLLAVPAVAGLAMAATAAKKPAAKAAAPQAKQAPPAAAARQDAPAARNAALAARKARIARSAKARAAKAMGPQKPDPALIAAYAAMPVADRRAIQSDLIWTGDYNGIISDEFGGRSIGAVKSYQARSGAADTGILTGEQRIALAAAAKAKQEESGWHVVDDTATGARLAVPTKHAPQSSATKTGTRWTSGRGEVQIETFRIAELGTTIAAVFEQQKKEPANREVEYSVLRETSFVVAGLQGLKRFYVRAHARQNDVRGVAVMYDQAMQGIMDRVAIAMSSRFEPFPSASAGPSTRHKVEYATAVVVDELGHVITDRQVTDSCLVITLAGLGNVELLAETAELALLRVYGARNLKPLAMGDGANVRDVTLVGIADPQAQGGGGMATTVVARLGTAENAKRVLEPAPALGFSGAAVTDTKGHLVGLVQLKGALVAGPTNVGAPAQLVPIEQIKAFLNGRNIAPAAAAASSPEAAKASVLRVICVRK